MLWIEPRRDDGLGHAQVMGQLRKAWKLKTPTTMPESNQALCFQRNKPDFG